MRVQYARTTRRNNNNGSDFPHSSLTSKEIWRGWLTDDVTWQIRFILHWIEGASRFERRNSYIYRSFYLPTLWTTSRTSLENFFRGFSPLCSVTLVHLSNGNGLEILSFSPRCSRAWSSSRPYDGALNAAIYQSRKLNSSQLERFETFRNWSVKDVLFARISIEFHG